MIIIKKAKDKITNNLYLMFSIFFVFPIIVTLVLLRYDLFPELSDKLYQFMEVSGYLLAVSNYFLFFILYRTLRFSDHKKSIANKNYLDKDAPQDLLDNLNRLMYCLSMGETEGLEEAVSRIKYIYQSIEEHSDDLILRAYFIQIKSITSLINKHKLESIGVERNNRKIKAIDKDGKMNLRREIYNLKQDLSNRIKDAKEDEINE